MWKFFSQQVIITTNSNRLLMSLIKNTSQEGVREWFHYFWTNCFHSSVHITSWIFVTTPENFLTEKLLWLCWTNGIFLIFDSTITEKMFIFSIFSLFFWIICSNFNDFFTRKILNEQNTFVTYVCRVLQTNLSLTCSIKYTCSKSSLHYNLYKIWSSEFCAVSFSREFAILVTVIKAISALDCSWTWLFSDAICSIKRAISWFEWLGEWSCAVAHEFYLEVRLSLQSTKTTDNWMV